MKVKELYKGRFVACYEERELAEIQPIIDQAREMWSNKAGAYFEKHGDRGSCTIGDGIEVYTIAKRGRKPRVNVIISTASVSPCCGSIPCESTQGDVINFLRSCGVAATYNYGNLD